MLTAMRRLAGTWPARLLFLLLLASFLVWGVEDVVRNFGRETAVARVGSESIELPEAQAAARREMTRIARQLGNRFEPNDDIRRAVAATALERLIAQYALRSEATRLGLAAPDAVVRDAVFAIPGLRGADGSFSRAVFDGFLRNNDLSETQFLRVMADDVLREQLSGAVRSGSAAPAAMTGPLLAWAFQRRSAAVVQVSRAAMPEPEAPGETQLQRFQENNASRFSSPEFREVSVLVLNAAALAGEVQVDEEALRQAYDARRAQYDTPERRVLYQAVVPQEAQAQAIAEAWRNGAELAAIETQARADDGGAADLGLLDRSMMPHAAVGDAAFAAPQGGVTTPIQSPFGWHVIKVERIEPAATRSFEQVKDELRQEVAQDRALDLAYERANRIEDALAGGASLAEAAERFGLSLTSLTLAANGQDQAGQAITLPVPEAQRPELLRAIFAAQQGEHPRMTEMGDAFVAISLQQVIPPALKPFASIEAELRTAWIEDARRREAEERAAALMAAVRGGKPIEEAAREAGLTVQAFGPFTRDPALSGAMPRELVAPVFELKDGETTMVPTDTGFAVAQLTGITPFDPGSDDSGQARVRTEVEQRMQDELEEQFSRAIRERANVRINPSVLDQVTGR